MRTIEATGAFLQGDTPLLSISGGSGNTDHAEVHLIFFDPDEGATLMGWFRVADLELAITEARNITNPGEL